MSNAADRRSRRTQVARVAFDLIAERGIEAVTFRQIAAETGFSTAIVSHYFQNKNELLFTIYCIANEMARERLLGAFDDGLPLVDCFETLLPISEESRKNWRVWLAFWGRAHVDPLYLEERRRAANDSLALYRRMLGVRSGDALSGRAQNLEKAARRLISLIAGLSLEACFAPEEWPPDRLRELLADELRDYDAT
ncbi:HTH-type transcriptional regulator BetI [Novosphingobium marinum]|uniref:AcrR family transcriptional regulator n=1 Tax=Novosphingobium marinum TaxID=1514948 RepID=A0A7Z0BT48_9SPHN|nr:TetR/AcrR family transcriptional regulator [Novosphingobium marinum]NYH93723.1 AcrR family transcriptional regulator [Novosphingobium marinum]GGC16810.1 HTH-type transcriptional regulator BetI [Novosphingobium marinum]